MASDLLKDREWAAVEDKLCLVTEFVPMAALENGRVAGISGCPLASVRLRLDTGTELTGFICHELEFLMLWTAFHQRTAVPGTRIEFGPAVGRTPPGIEDTVEKFRTFYTGILNQGGERKLRSLLAAERVLSERLEAEEEAVFLGVVDQLERELLGEEVWLTWTRKRYRPRHLAIVLRPFLPKLIVMVAKKGAFDLLHKPSIRPDLEGQAYAREVVPLITWTPEVMD